MKPDKSNYEILIIDWLDGKLDKAATEKLMDFLLKNPDLKEEADSLSSVLHAPPYDTFPGKEKLFKTPAELPFSQVEQLSIAFLEKDITPEQLGDLKQSTLNNPANKNLFDSIQKTRLTPLNYVFPDKNHLKKESTTGKIFRLSVMSLSSAAAITLLLLSYFLVPRLITQNETLSSSFPVPDTLPKEPFIVRTTVFTETFSTSPVMADRIDSASPEAGSDSPDNTITGPQSLSDEAALPLLTQKINYSVKRSAVPAAERIANITYHNKLIASSIRYREHEAENDNRLSRFLARNFRGKILKEEFPGDDPLKSYEIAEAGIEGLNKLLGWEMVLVKNSNEEGDVSSLYFSSRMLKFNTPVKKTDLPQ